jgi:hypothetical protein
LAISCFNVDFGDADIRYQFQATPFPAASRCSRSLAFAVVEAALANGRMLLQQHGVVAHDVRCSPILGQPELEFSGVMAHVGAGADGRFAVVGTDRGIETERRETYSKSELFNWLIELYA